jgi:hypothetical protein
VVTRHSFLPTAQSGVQALEKAGGVKNIGFGIKGLLQREKGCGMVAQVDLHDAHIQT